MSNIIICETSNVKMHSWYLETIEGFTCGLNDVKKKVVML